jgi:serine/threonine-protein kinase RsbW
MSENQPQKCEFNSRDLVVRLDMSLVGDVHAIDPAVKAIMEIVAQMTCGKGSEFEIETALRESLANAIVHGCGEDRERTVKISVGCDEGRGMIIVVRDPGPGFDPSKLPNPVEGQQIFSESGRGIFLINQLMDEVRFRKGGAEIWMRKG